MAEEKEPDKITFISLHGPVSLLCKTEKYDRNASGDSVRVQDVEWIKFVDGTFTTNDPAKIKFIEKSHRYKAKTIVEKKVVDAKKEQIETAQEMGARIATMSPGDQAKLKASLSKIEAEK